MLVMPCHPGAEGDRTRVGIFCLFEVFFVKG
jgi:hypothetical protein